LAVVAVRWTERPRDKGLTQLIDDLTGLLEGLRRTRRSTGQILLALAGLSAALLIGVRALLVPVISWDSLTYHGLKAGLWVQGAGPIELIAPGGWSIYRLYPGGGEVLHAWAMLPWRGDLLAGLVDVLSWLLLGVAAHALGGQLGLSRAARWVVAAYLLSLPAAARTVGSLYVDNAFAFSLTAALVFAILAVRGRNTSALLPFFMAAGVALGIKVFAIPTLLLLVPLVVGLLLRELMRPRGMAWLLTGLTAALLVAAPWFARNWRETGYPLSPYPVSVAGVQLGEANDAMRWYLDRSELEGLGPADELRAAARLFGVPGMVSRDQPVLGVLTVLPLLLALAALIRWVRRDWRLALILFAGAAPLVASYCGGDMRATRLIWAEVNGRYLLAVVAVAVAASFGVGSKSRRWQSLYAGILVVGSAVYLVMSDLFDWRATERLTAAVAVAAFLILGLAAIRWGGLLHRAVAVAALLVAPLVAMALLQVYRDTTREVSLLRSNVLHQVPRYWVEALPWIDAPGNSHKLAFTGGRHQDADNCLLYHFLGRRLQNELTYVPVTFDGEIVEPVHYRERVAAADLGSWVGRLRARGVTEVVSFGPASLELVWMERQSGAFSRLAGDGRRWGLYRLDEGEFRQQGFSSRPRRRAPG
jgi:hypothetical protein